MRKPFPVPRNSNFFTCPRDFFCIPTLKISPTLLYLGRQDSVLIHYRDILIPLKIQIPAQEYYAKLFSFAPAETLVSMILTLSHPYIQDPFSGSLVYLERFVGVQVKRKLETGEKGTRTRNMADGTNAKGDIMMWKIIRNKINTHANYIKINFFLTFFSFFFLCMFIIFLRSRNEFHFRNFNQILRVLFFCVKICLHLNVRRR